MSSRVLFTKCLRHITTVSINSVPKRNISLSFVSSEKIVPVHKVDSDSSLYFERQSEKNKENFQYAIELYLRNDQSRRGSIEFILAALKNMKSFGVHRDIESYRSLIDIMPKGKYIPRNSVQKMFGVYPRQQDCISQVLDQMQKNKVMPDEALANLVRNIFGMKSEPCMIIMTMVYWMQKFKNLSPFPLPFHLPNDSMELAKLAIKQITSVDRNTEITIFDCEDLEDSVDKTWIVSGQSVAQKEIIENLPKEKALYVEGAFRVWLQDKSVNYFVLRGEGVPLPPEPEINVHDVSNIKNWAKGEFHPHDLVKIPNRHEQEDGTIIACCATGTSSKDSLLSWIRFLQKDNPDLEGIPILFMINSPLGKVVPVMEENTQLKF